MVISSGLDEKKKKPPTLSAVRLLPHHSEWIRSKVYNRNFEQYTNLYWAYACISARGYVACPLVTDQKGGDLLCLLLRTCLCISAKVNAAIGKEVPLCYTALLFVELV
ncbi:hypothetical protein [Porphyromonas pogonae]|uniref:hypothetical protein n=1 Tax=Porphyromonas pogonae TaxID=867595 RepID=UPI002E7916E0|nr:hypothetical protein [Porphyromonas pogonae]